MIINRINTYSYNNVFKANQEPISAATQPTDNKTGVKSKWNNLTPTQKYIIEGAGVLLLLLAVLKGKSLIKMFKRNKTENLPDLNPNETGSSVGRTVTVEQPKVEDVIKTDDINVKKDVPTLSPTTSYASQYESAVQAERDFMSRVKDSSNLTEREQQSHWELSHKIGEIKNEAKANHASIVIRRSESDFPEDKALNASEKSRYIQKDVLWRMNTNKESALDGLDMFEQYGQKESYKTSNTMYELSRRITSLPVSDRSDKVLSRYLDIMEKIGEKDSKYEDCYELASAMRIYIDENSGDLSNTTVLRGIKLVKELSTRRQPGENVCEGLRKCSGEKDILRDDPAIQSAAEDLRNYIKDMPY